MEHNITGLPSVASVGVIITLIGGLIAGTLRFGGVETRLLALETNQPIMQIKLDRIGESLARIEGRLQEQTNQNRNSARR